MTLLKQNAHFLNACHPSTKKHIRTHTHNNA